MLTRSFIVFPHMTRLAERKLWDAGIVSWDDFLNAGDATLQSVLGRVPRKALRCVEPYRRRITDGDVAFFHERLPPAERFRAYPDFSDSVCFLDIETTGSMRAPENITVVGCYDGDRAIVFRFDVDIAGCMDYLARFKVLVTYNGASFDLPMIEKFFHRRLHPHLHIDLRSTFRALGISMGLKRLENEFGIPRDETLRGANGYEAILLWRKYRKNGDRDALERLIRYNLSDAVNLEPLLRIAYDRHIMERRLPFRVLDRQDDDWSSESIIDGALTALQTGDAV